MCKCEACKHFPHTVTFIDKGLGRKEDVEYKLCNNCVFQFVTLALTKQQYKNLLNSGHKASEYYLHDDFYEEDGTALQPKFLVSAE